jgi:hypothetical protein
MKVHRICAYLIEQELVVNAKGKQVPHGVITVCLADRERAGLEEPIRQDARRAGRGVGVVVWHCGGLYCQSYCKKEKVYGSQVKVKKQKAS